MAQHVQTEAAKAKIVADGFLQGTQHLVDSQGRLQTAGLSVAQAMDLKEASREECDAIDKLPVEQPLTISYVATCRQGHCIIYVGPQISSLGFTQQAWLGKPELRLQHIHDDDLERVKAAMRHSCETGEKFNCHYRLYDSAGRVHWFHDEANVVSDESGEHLFVMGAMRDITDMKEMEEELNQHRYYLERKVEQRTDELARRITLLESCNAALCDKLAQARREITALHKKLGRSMGELADIGDGLKNRIKEDEKLAGVAA